MLKRTGWSRRQERLRSESDISGLDARVYVCDGALLAVSVINFIILPLPSLNVLFLLERRCDVCSVSWIVPRHAKLRFVCFQGHLYHMFLELAVLNLYNRKLLVFGRSVVTRCCN